MTKDTIETAGTHTATPWHIERGDSIVSIMANDKRVAATNTKTFHEKFDATDLANAAFIVKAVNGYGKLVEALKPFAEEAEYWVGGSDSDAPFDVYFTVADLHRAAALLEGTAIMTSISTKGNTIIAKGKAKDFPRLAESAAIERWFEANVGQPIPVQEWWGLGWEEVMTKEPESLTLKWGTLKAWKINSEKSLGIMEEYLKLGTTHSAMAQRDTPEQKQLLCDLIDSVDGEIWNDWEGTIMTKEGAKKYVMEYGKPAAVEAERNGPSWDSRAPTEADPDAPDWARGKS